MNTYTFEIAIFDIEIHERIEVMVGRVQAERSGHAQNAAWPLVIARCDEYKAIGRKVGVGDLHTRIINV